MKIKLIISFLVLAVTACNSSRKMSRDTNLLNEFQNVITGDFDNSNQIATEIKNGKQIHPYAKHVNRVFDEKITDLPQTNARTNFWILEESYYTYPDKPMEIKPYLFNFSQGEKNMIELKVYQFPASIKKEDLRNDNKNLKVSLKDIIPSPTFKGATYYYDANRKVFTTNSTHDLGNDLKFTLTETLSAQQLIVMELLEKAGKRITPYDTPIVYDRK